MSESKNTLHVILADDHALVRAGIRQFLEHSAEIEVIFEAKNGDEVLNYLAQVEGRKTADVVVLDIKMPVKNGVETAAIIREKYPDLGILILSAFDDPPYIKAVLEAGAHGYMLKSTTPEQLVTAVQEIAHGRSMLSPAIASKLLGIVGEPLDHHDDLTGREIDVLHLLKEGKTNKEMGQVLNISSRTVQTHLANIYRKLKVSNRTEALSYATQAGLFEQAL